jgi:hypothetical protein
MRTQIVRSEKMIKTLSLEKAPLKIFYEIGCTVDGCFNFETGFEPWLKKHGDYFWVTFNHFKVTKYFNIIIVYCFRSVSPVASAPFARTCAFSDFTQFAFSSSSL